MSAPALERLLLQSRMLVAFQFYFNFFGTQESGEWWWLSNTSNPKRCLLNRDSPRLSSAICSRKSFREGQEQ